MCQAAKKLQRLEEEEEAITEHAKEERERAARVRQEEEAREAAAGEAKREDAAAVHTHAVGHAHGAGEKSKKVQHEPHEAHRGRHLAVRKRRARVGVAGTMAAAHKAAHKAAVNKGAVRSKGRGEVKKGGGAWAERLRYALSQGTPLSAPRHAASSDAASDSKEDGKVAMANFLKILCIVAFIVYVLGHSLTFETLC